MAQQTQTHVFLISTQENEDRFQIQISEASVQKIKQVIASDIIPKSIYRIALQDIAWNIHYIEKENRLIALTDDTQLVSLLHNSKKDPFPIAIVFENQHKFQSWLHNAQTAAIPTPDIIAVTAIPGAVAINLELPHNINMYSIHYQVQQLSDRHTHNTNSRDVLPSHIAYRSPIIIRNLWPYQAYRFRIRLKSKLFRSQHSIWTKWIKSTLTVPPPLKLYNKAKIKKETEERYKSRFELLDKRKFIEWLQRKLSDDAFWSTEFERKCVIPKLMATISHAKCKLKAKAVLLKDPKQYIADVMDIYTKYVECKEDHISDNMDNESQLSELSLANVNTNSITSRRLRPSRNRSKLKTYEQHKLKQLSDIIQIYNASTGQSGAGNFTPHDLLHYLRDEEIQNTVKSKGINIQQMRAMISSDIVTTRTHQPSLASISKHVDQHSFSSILWRLRQAVCRESSHIECECDNPYAVNIWIYFVKEPLKHQYFLYCDKKYVALEPCLNYSDCYLYRATYYVRCDPFNVNLPFNLCEKARHKPQNQKPIFLANPSDKRENIMIESQKNNILIAKVYNDANALFYGEKRSDVVSKIKQICDWNSLSIPRGFFHSCGNKEELEYLECMLHYLCGNVGVTIPLSTAIATLNHIWSIHKGKDTKTAHKASEMIGKKFAVQRKMFTTKTVLQLYDHPTWYSWSYIVAALFYLFYLFGSDEIHKEKKHKLFDHRMRSCDLLQLLLNGKYGAPKRAFALLACVLNDGVSVKHQIVNQFITRIVHSIHHQSNVLIKYQFALWYKCINCALLNGKCSLQPKLSTNLQHTTDLSREMIKLLRIDYNIELISKIPRTQPLEKECLTMLRTHIQQHKKEDNQE